MDHREILKHVDHTLLRTTATWPEVRQTLDDGLKYGAAAVCIPPAFLRRAGEHCGSRVKLCAAIGFPNGYNTTEVKVFETEQSVQAGAEEIDVVVNLGLVKEGDWEGVLRELKAVRLACQGRVLKVIVEACQLTQAEKERICQVVSQSGAEYIKTSTGFSTGGATVEDVALFRQRIAPGMKIKAAGGIRTWEDAEKLLAAGADRLGTSALVGLAKQEGI